MKNMTILAYVLTALMLSTSAVYFTVTYQQFTDESGSGIHEISGEKETQQGTSDFDKSQWYELDLGGKIQTIFFLIVAIVYTPVGIWMLKNSNTKKPYFIAFMGSLSLIVFYIISRTINLPIVGIQNDVGSIDIAVKILQGGIMAGAIHMIRIKRKLENNPTSN